MILLGELLDVGAGREHLLAAEQHDGTHARVGSDLGGGRTQLFLHLRVERIHRRPVESDHRDACGYRALGARTVRGADLDAHQLCHQLSPAAVLQVLREPTV